ncbi:MAG: glycoside hydrolase family 43 protein [Eubacterium sp.]|nr:glycoside hydrolase family 43 protein [Eubacterium sp.]
MAYLFVHFKEKITIDGEQVYFAVSKNGYDWEQLNNGNPILTCDKGEKGCRDIEIVKLKNGGFVVIATNLCVVNRMDENYNIDWEDINHNGSKCLSVWFSDDLVHFSEQKLMNMGRNDFGCLWAPEVFYDEIRDEYLVHWSSTVAEDNFSHMSIYCSTTKDFKTFSEPKLFFTKENSILDSHIVKVKDTYHLFYKNGDHPSMNMHATSDNLYGEYKNDDDFQAIMSKLDRPGSYEAPTTYVLPDGRWCLMLDFFGCEKEKMGYVPFVSDQVGDAHFKMDKEAFTFPYGFKHGHAIEISDEEYNRLIEFYDK